MKKSYQIILYFLVLVLIGAGILAVIFAQPIFDYLRAGNTLTPETMPAPTLTTADTLDPAALQTPGTKELTNHVLSFNFDNICYRPDTINVSAVPVTVFTPGETGTPVVGESPSVGCQKGSSLPFVVKIK